MSGWTFDERFKAWANSQALTLVTPNNTLAVATSKDMEAAFLGGIAAALPTPADLCSVCGHPAQPGLTLNLEPVCTNCVRAGTAFKQGESMSSDRKPVTVDDMLAWLLSPEVKAVNPKLDMRFSYEQVVSFLTEIQSLRSRVESLERAHGLKPGTSMHAAWKEGNE